MQFVKSDVQTVGIGVQASAAAFSRRLHHQCRLVRPGHPGLFPGRAADTLQPRRATLRCRAVAEPHRHVPGLVPAFLLRSQRHRAGPGAVP